MIYAIADIHGQKARLDEALARVEADGGPDAEIVFLGDYTDRGPNSRGVLQTLIDGRDAGRPWRFLMGNHDRMFYRFVTEAREHDARVRSGISWINQRLGGPSTLASYGLAARTRPAFLMDVNGGRETLASYEIECATLSAPELANRAREAVPPAHLDFLADLELMHRTQDLLFVHAGIRPGVPLDAQDPEDLLWIREGFLDDDRDHGLLVVHGHTALQWPEHFGNRIDLDGGAGFGGDLTPAVFEGRDCWLLTETGRERLEPPRWRM